MVLFGAGLVILLILFVVIVKAEERHDWGMAQAALVAIMLLCWLVGWVWWREKRESCPLPIEAATYDRAIRNVLLCVGYWVYGPPIKCQSLGPLAKWIGC